MQAPEVKGTNKLLDAVEHLKIGFIAVPGCFGSIMFVKIPYPRGYIPEGYGHK